MQKCSSRKKNHAVHTHPPPRTPTTTTTPLPTPSATHQSPTFVARLDHHPTTPHRPAQCHQRLHGPADREPLVLLLPHSGRSTPCHCLRRTPPASKMLLGMESAISMPNRRSLAITRTGMPRPACPALAADPLLRTDRHNIRADALPWTTDQQHEGGQPTTLALRSWPKSSCLACPGSAEA